MTRMSLAERRQKLISAALGVVAEQGVAAATTRAIAAAAGMPLASFHYAFESHQVLMVEAFEHLTGAQRDRTVELSGSTRSEVVAEVLQGHVEALRDNGADQLAAAELADHLLRTGSESGVPAQWYRDRVADLSCALQVRADAGVDLGTSAEQLATLLVTFQDGLTQTAALTGDVESVRATAELFAAGLWESTGR